MPAYNPEFFRVAEPAEPKLSARRSADPHPLQPEDRSTPSRRCWRGSRTTPSTWSSGPSTAPRSTAGLVKIDGFPMGVIGNRQGLIPNYPEYTNEYHAVGGKLYRQGLIKMNEFVTHVRPRPPAHHLAPGHLGHRRGRHRREGGAPGPGAVADLLDRADGRPHDADRAAQGHGGGPLRHGRPHGQQQQRLHPGHPRHRDLRHARRDGGGGSLTPAGS